MEIAAHPLTGIDFMESSDPKEPQGAEPSLQVSGLPVMLSVMIPIQHFKVVDLLRLHVGYVLFSSWPQTEDVPLHTGGVCLGWCEFEMIDQGMAARLVRLA